MRKIPKKNSTFALLIPFTLVVILISSLPTLATSQVLGVSAIPLNNKCGAYTTYQITFIPPIPLEKGDLIIVNFINLTKGCWNGTYQGVSQAGNASLATILDTVNCKLIINTTYPPTECTVTLIAAEAIGAETKCLVQLTGIKNPMLPGNYMVNMSMRNATHVKATHSVSPTFEIVAPSFTGAIIANMITQTLILADSALSAIKPETVSGIIASIPRLLEIARSFITAIP